MTNKAEKRVLCEPTAVGQSENTNSISPEAKKGVKKAKLNFVTAQKNNKALVSGESKKWKKNKVNKSESGFQISDVTSDKQETKTEVNKDKNEKLIQKRKLKYLKAKQLKREKRKQQRREEGQYGLDITMTKEEMRKKIDIITSRQNITKTAKRKLRILKKKLEIAEGNIPPPPSKIKTSVEGTSKLTKSQKKKLKQEKVKLENASVEQKEASNKSKNQKTKKNKELQKSAQKKEIPIKSEKESSDEGEDDSDNQSEEETSENMPIKMEVNDSSDEEEDENDEEEGENDEEEDENDDEEEEADDSDEEDDEGDSEEEKDSNIKNIAKNKVMEKLPVQKIKKVSDGKKDMSATKKTSQENVEKKQRYVLFVGNIPFKATVDDIKQHFLQKVSEVVSVRIPTIKETKRPRGFAYVEVTNNIDYEKALSLHQTSLQGFKINVEYTQTGSKNIKNKQEIVAKNKKLHAIRKAGKLAGSKKENGRRSFRRNLKKKQQAQKE